MLRIPTFNSSNPPILLLSCHSKEDLHFGQVLELAQREKGATRCAAATGTDKFDTRTAEPRAVGYEHGSRQSFGSGMTLPQRREIETDRRLLLLVGLVVVVAAVIVATSLPAAVALGEAGHADRRSRSSSCSPSHDRAGHARQGTGTDPVHDPRRSVGTRPRSSLVLAIAPASVVVLCTAVGITFASLRLPPIKLAFGVGKNVIVAWGAGIALAMTTWTWPPESTSP